MVPSNFRLVVTRLDRGNCCQPCEKSWSPPATPPTLWYGAATRSGTGEPAVRDSAAPFQRGERDSPPPQVGHRLFPWRHKTGTPPETAAESHSPRRQSDKSFSMRRLTEYPPPSRKSRPKRRVAPPPRLTRAAEGSTSRTPSSRGLGSARSKASVKQDGEGLGEWTGQKDSGCLGVQG